MPKKTEYIIGLMPKADKRWGAVPFAEICSEKRNPIGRSGMAYTLHAVRWMRDILP